MIVPFLVSVWLVGYCLAVIFDNLVGNVEFNLFSVVGHFYLGVWLMRLVVTDWYNWRKEKNKKIISL